MNNIILSPENQYDRKNELTKNRLELHYPALKSAQYSLQFFYLQTGLQKFLFVSCSDFCRRPDTNVLQ